MVAESVWQWGKDMQIVYRPKRDNDRADALSRNPLTAQQDDHLEVGAQVAQVTSTSEENASHLLQEEPGSQCCCKQLSLEQKKEPGAKDPLCLSSAW